VLISHLRVAVAEMGAGAPVALLERGRDGNSVGKKRFLLLFQKEGLSGFLNPVTQNAHLSVHHLH
jgi:hypothetical protein